MTAPKGLRRRRRDKGPEELPEDLEAFFRGEVTTPPSVARAVTIGLLEHQVELARGALRRAIGARMGVAATEERLVLRAELRAMDR